MENIIILCWYLVGIVCLIALAKWSHQRIASNLPLIIAAGFLGPVALPLGFILGDIVPWTPRLKTPEEARDETWNLPG